MLNIGPDKWSGPDYPSTPSCKCIIVSFADKYWPKTFHGLWLDIHASQHTLSVLEKVAPILIQRKHLCPFTTTTSGHSKSNQAALICFSITSYTAPSWLKTKNRHIHVGEGPAPEKGQAASTTPPSGPRWHLVTSANLNHFVIDSRVSLV